MTQAHAPQRKRKFKRQEVFWGYLCVAPLSAGLLLFLFVPLVYALYLSLTTYDLFNEPTFIGMGNFARAMKDTQFWGSLINAVIACVGVVIVMVVSMVLANLLSKNLKGTNFFRMVFFLPAICSAVAITIMWQNLLDYHFGTLNNLLAGFGIDKIYWLDEKRALPSLIFMGIWSGLGINILLYLSAIKSVPATYYEAARLDGAGPFGMFFHITFPAVSPVSFYILMMGLIGVLQDFTKYQVMTNGNPKSTLMPVLLIFKYSGGDYGAFYGYASALALILGLIIAAVTGLNFLGSKKWVSYES
jgi:multiple sugar transport system permease protein